MTNVLDVHVAEHLAKSPYYPLSEDIFCKDAKTLQVTMKTAQNWVTSDKNLFITFCL